MKVPNENTTKYPVPEDMGWTHEELRNPAYDGDMGIFEGYGEYCQCGKFLASEAEQRDGVCRECL